MKNQKRNVIILMGGPSAEHDVSLATGRVIMNALDKNNYNVMPVTITKERKWLLPRKENIFLADDRNKKEKELEAIETGGAIGTLTFGKADVVFIAMHGIYGEDGTIQGLLEFTDMPYTGSGVLASALAMDKLKSGKMFAFHGLLIPKYLDFSRDQWHKDKENIIAEIQEKISFPCVIKPSRCGSSVGVSIVKNVNDMEHAVQSAFLHDTTILVQKYISGMEVTCAVLDEGGGKEPIALPPTQIIPKDSDFFDYHAKYTAGATEEITPPRMHDDIIKKIQEHALRAHTILGCAGMSRTDMIVSGNDIFVLETNTIPGMTETSLYPQAAAAIGISFPELLDKIIQAAINKKSAV